MEEIYRFRNTENLLDKFNELENQKIYFASPEELNDPMEGFRDVFWKGDQIVWRNFFLNYIKSFEKFFRKYVVLKEEQKINVNDFAPFSQFLIAESNLYKKITDEICSNFINDRFMSKLIDSLSKRKNTIKRNELTAHLHIVHLFVLHYVNDIYLQNGIISKSIFNVNVLLLNEKFSETSFASLMNEIEKITSKDVSESYFSFLNSFAQSFFLKQTTNLRAQNLHNFTFLASDFTSSFLDFIIEEIYPPWYSASFLSDCTNSAIWGHYGDNHRGVCLIFNVENNKDDENNNYFLNLEKEYGYSDKPLIGFRPQNFVKIDYDSKPSEIDFFISVGRLRKFEIEKLWFRDENFNLSNCHDKVFQNQDKWREQYWNEFSETYSKKLKEWDYEKEQRIILHGDLTDYTERNKRKLKYDFKSLKGIIFGIRTSQTDKMKIINIIKRKCDENNLDINNFEFYQSEYSRQTGKIEKFRLLSI